MAKRKLCDQCKRPVSVCYCQFISKHANEWPVTILQHYKETHHPLSTATIAKLGLSHCDILLSNDPYYHEKKEQLINQQPLLIYPGEESIPIEEMKFEKPRPLVFLDGTWRKTRLLLHESPELNQITKVSINPDSISRYRIRKSPNPQALSTLEAIVHVLSLLEKDQTKFQSLLDAMDQMVNKQIELMGEETFKRNYLNKD